MNKKCIEIFMRLATDDHLVPLHESRNTFLPINPKRKIRKKNHCRSDIIVGLISREMGSNHRPWNLFQGLCSNYSHGPTKIVSRCCWDVAFPQAAVLSPKDDLYC